jgi:hypothetical protein
MGTDGEEDGGMMQEEEEEVKEEEETGESKTVAVPLSLWPLSKGKLACRCCCCDALELSRLPRRKQVQQQLCPYALIC